MDKENSFTEQWKECLDTSTADILQTEESMIEFFEFLIRERSNHTVFNKIMIRAYCPKATYVLRKEDWESAGFTITKPEEAIWTMRYYGRRYGFFPQLEYDISATSAADSKLPNEQISADHIVELLLADPPVPLDFFPGGSSTLKCFYNPSEKKITYTAGFLSWEEICSRFYREYAHYFMHSDDYRWKQMVWSEKNAGVPMPYEYPRGTYDGAATIAVYLLESKFKTKHLGNTRFYSNFDNNKEARDYLQMALSATNRIVFHLKDVDRRLQEEDEAAQRKKLEEEKGGG